MKSTITNGQLAAIVSNLLTNPFSGELDSTEGFAQFCTDIAQVVCDYCGGEVVTPASYAPPESCMDWGSHYALEVQPNESSPEDGGLWGNPIPPSQRAASEIIRKLLQVLHPGAVGLIGNHHGMDRCNEACDAVNEAKAMLARFDGQGGTETFSGYFGYEGTTLRADFEVPAGATTSEKDAAFLAALAQQADIDYLAVGATPAKCA